jgi:hypothetical protein
MSQITIVNNTDQGEVVRVAIYKKPILTPTLATIAWKVVAPPPSSGQTIVQIPESYTAYANYSYDPDEREDPNAGNRTAILNFSETTARFVIGTSSSQDNRANAANITQDFTNLVRNEVRMENRFGYGVWSHITKDGDDIYAPQILWPGAVRMEDIRASLYLAVVAEFLDKGDRLVDEEIGLTETELLEGGTAVVTGSKWKGYAIAVTN